MAAAALLAEGLRSASHEVWTDWESVGSRSKNWRKAVVEAIKAADCVVFLASESAVVSRNCYFELSIAGFAGRPVIGVILYNKGFAAGSRVDRLVGKTTPWNGTATQLYDVLAALALASNS